MICLEVALSKISEIIEGQIQLIFIEEYFFELNWEPANTNFILSTNRTGTKCL